jgi:uncharacterized protein GlcG (DUF336 family)
MTTMITPLERTSALLATLAIAVLITGCSGGGTANGPGSGPTDTDCSGQCASASLFLTVADVETIIAQGVAEARARNVQATFAVVDRVGNALAVYRMGDAAARPVLIATRVDENGDAILHVGLEGIRLPSAAAPFNIDHLAAIAKAITGAYLSSEGNAFTTRTASQIVQENFNPGESDQPSGPLFGVQFSQLPCSDFSQRYSGAGTSVGPHRSPLGLSADPGGFPLYKGGTVVGGVGVLADGLYGADLNISDRDLNPDELIALAATHGFAAPADRRGDRITADGKTFRFSDVESADLAVDPAAATPFAALDPTIGALIAVEGYSDGTIVPGTAFTTATSGIRADGGVDYSASSDAFVFVDAANLPRFPPSNGTDGAAGLTAAEVKELLQAALDLANRSRAQIRRPLGSQARVTISVVDTNGEVLGIVRTRDAPIFGADVSLQKARVAAFLSGPSAAAGLGSLNGAPARYIEFPPTQLVDINESVNIADYVAATDTFLGLAGTFGTGSVAFSDRAIGNLARPFYPDGLGGQPNGPLSKNLQEWSPLSTGLQLDMSINAILQHVFFAVTNGAVPDVPLLAGCTGVALDFPGGAPTFSVVPHTTGLRAANGLQIFPGSVPIYRGNMLIGGIGVSGDGVDQDDMISFLGLHNAAANLGGNISNAPVDMRADRLGADGVRLRYVQCPQAPFIDSDDQNACADK